MSDLQHRVEQFLYREASLMDEMGNENDNNDYIL